MSTTRREMTADEIQRLYDTVEWIDEFLVDVAQNGRLRVGDYHAEDAVRVLAGEWPDSDPSCKTGFLVELWGEGNQCDVDNTGPIHPVRIEWAATHFVNGLNSDKGGMMEVMHYILFTAVRNGIGALQELRARMSQEGQAIDPAPLADLDLSGLV